MTIPADSVIKTNIKNRLSTAGMNLGNSQFTDDFINIIVEEIMDAVKQATVTTSVTVTSVSGVTVGAGVSGPGVGSGSGSIS